MSGREREREREGEKKIRQAGSLPLLGVDAWECRLCTMGSLQIHSRKLQGIVCFLRNVFGKQAVSGILSRDSGSVLILGRSPNTSPVGPLGTACLSAKTAESEFIREYLCSINIKGVLFTWPTPTRQRRFWINIHLYVKGNFEQNQALDIYSENYLEQYLHLHSSRGQTVSMLNKATLKYESWKKWIHPCP